MENTTENKARFFALYINQPVFMMPDWLSFNDNRPMPLEIIYLQKGSRQLNSGFLSLRSISSLTDQEYVEVARRCGFSKQNLSRLYLINAGKGLISMFSEDTHLSANAIDYLRSIGILIPWMDLSVEQIIEYGWAKEDTSC